MKYYILSEEDLSSMQLLLADKLKELIRCKDCRWYKTNYSWNGKEHHVCGIEPYEPVRKADDFCSSAERREK